jgi:biopolymer transport protein ExbD
MFAFAAPRARRKPSLTPMIDVVFLLLVFFMLAARFGTDMVLPLSPAGGGNDEWVGAPRLVVVEPDVLLVNGSAVLADDLGDRLRPLMPAPDSPVVLQARTGTDMSRLVAVIDALRRAGITNLVLVE